MLERADRGGGEGADQWARALSGRVTSVPQAEREVRAGWAVRREGGARTSAGWAREGGGPRWRGGNSGPGWAQVESWVGGLPGWGLGPVGFGICWVFFLFYFYLLPLFYF